MAEKQRGATDCDGQAVRRRWLLMVTWLAAVLFSVGAGAAAGQSGYRISGTVVDGKSGQGLAGTQVSIAPAGDRGKLRTVTSGADGRFVFDGVPAGKSVLSAKRHGYAPQQYKEHESYTTAIVTGPGHNAENIRFALMPAATISGVVTDETGEAVREARVSLLAKEMRAGKNSSTQYTNAVTDDEGRYRFAHLRAGTYVVEVTAEPWYANGETRVGVGLPFSPAEVDRGRMSDPEYVESLLAKRLAEDKASASPDPELDVVYPRTFYANAHSVEEATPIHVGAGDNAIADIALRSTPALHLRVQIGGSGRVMVRRPMEGGMFQPGRSGAADESGMAEVGGLEAGPVTIYVLKKVTGEDPPTESRVVQLTADMELNGNTFDEAVTVRGEVTREDGVALPTATVIMTNVESGYAMPLSIRQADGEGATGKLFAALGIYELALDDPAGVVVGVTAKGAKVAGQKITLGAEKEVELKVAVAVGQGSVDGVALQDGKPAEGAMMLLVPEEDTGNMAWCRRDQSDSDGTFTFANVVAGKYVALALSDGWGLEWSKREVVEKYLARGTKVEVGKGGVAGLKVEVQ